MKEWLGRMREIICRACSPLPAWGGWRRFLDVGESAVFAKDGESVEEDVVVGAGGPGLEIVNGEVGAEIVGGVAAGIRTSHQ